MRWLNDQPPWSDFPIVLLTHQGGGPSAIRTRCGSGQVLGNVTFLERPFPSDHAGERRRLRRQGPAPPVRDARDPRGSHRKRGLLHTALSAGRLGALELHLPDLELEASDTCKKFFGREPGEPLLVSGSAGARFIPTIAQGVSKCVNRTHRDRQRLQHRVPQYLARRIAALGRRPRPRGSPAATAASSRWSACASDITARKVAEIERENLLAQLAAERTALAELTATLEQRVEQRTAELMKEVAAREQAQEQLRQAQKMETIGQLTGGVAHDFNNLLMAVMGNLDLLRKRMPDDPRLHRLIDGALQGAERGASLTQRLLAFARQQDLRAVPVDLRALVQAWSTCWNARSGRASRCGSIFPQGLPPARVDANQLELAILNLAINARDAMPDGGSIDIRIARISGERRSGAAAGPLSEAVRHRYRHRHDARRY